MALGKADGYTPSCSGTLVCFTVDDIEKTLGRVGAKGGKILNPKTAIGEYGFIAHGAIRFCQPEC